MVWKSVIQGSMTIVRQPLTLDAIEWTGENLDAVQTFMQPSSPLFSGGPINTLLTAGVTNPMLRIYVLDGDSMAKWPSLGQQHALRDVYVGDWICRAAEGSFGVIRKVEFDREWKTQEALKVDAAADALQTP